MGTEHLIVCGHKNIGFVSGPTRIETAAERLSGYDETISATRLRPLVAFGDFRFEGGVRATSDSWRKVPPPFSSPTTSWQ